MNTTNVSIIKLTKILRFETKILVFLLGHYWMSCTLKINEYKFETNIKTKEIDIFF